MPGRKQTEQLGEQNWCLGTIISSSKRCMLASHLQDLNSAGFSLGKKLKWLDMCPGTSTYVLPLICCPPPRVWWT